MLAGRAGRIVGLALILATGELAYAGEVTLKMGGQVAYSSDPSLTGIHVGDTWNLTYTFSSDAIDTNLDPGYGQYPEDSVSFTVNGQPLSVEQHPYDIFVNNDVAGLDSYAVHVFFSPFGGFEDNWPALHINMVDFDASVFSGELLPLSILPLSAFESITFDIQDMLNGGYMAQGTVTYWMPEPATLSLLALGGLTVTRRHR